jgi:hypothetical protein
MPEYKKDSELLGWADEPQKLDDGRLTWRVKFKKHELQDMIDKYTTTVTEKGGGNVYLTLFQSKSGKACCRVYDPNSEGAKEARAKKQASLQDDLPF